MIRFLPFELFFLIEPLSEVTITPPGRLPVSVSDVSVEPFGGGAEAASTSLPADREEEA